MSRTYRKIPIGDYINPQIFKWGLVSLDVRHNTNGYVGEGIRKPKSKKLFKRFRKKRFRYRLKRELSHVL